MGGKKFLPLSPLSVPSLLPNETLVGPKPPGQLLYGVSFPERLKEKNGRKEEPINLMAPKIF